MYLVTSSLTTGANINNPITLGNTIAKIMASEKPITEPKLAAEPITKNTKKGSWEVK